MKKWKIQAEFRANKAEMTIEALIDVLLKNRSIITLEQKEEFLNPKLENVTPEKVGIDKKHLRISLLRIKKAIEKKEKIIVFGDYDVDGITGAAILWEALTSLGANTMPYIPNRLDEGYGLSKKGIESVLNLYPDTKVIITVDNGIVAYEPVEFANAQGIEVIITDHHALGEKLPEAYSIVHTTKLCGAGVAWLLANELKNKSEKLKIESDEHLELATLGTVADLVPLTGGNRAIVKYGLDSLCQTKRPGLLALFQESACDQNALGVYQIGYIIAPRLNAAGRLENAMDSLRLLCTRDHKRAYFLAQKLGVINRERQNIMLEATKHAVDRIKNQESRIKNLLFVGHESYPEGIIGLVAGRLVEEFYRPAIILSLKKPNSKASARSISGFNMIEFLRSFPEEFINVGGHPMAAGFTIKTANLVSLQEKLEKRAAELLTDELLTRSLKIDCELSLEQVSQELYDALQQLGPFGMGNPEPTFVSRNVTVSQIKALGKDGKHLKFEFKYSQTTRQIEGVAFNVSDTFKEIKPGQIVDIVYALDQNTWNGQTKLQLKIKDLKV